MQKQVVQKQVVQRVRENAMLRTMMEVKVGENMKIKAGGFKFNPFRDGAVIKLKKNWGYYRVGGLRLLQQTDVTSE